MPTQEKARAKAKERQEPQMEYAETSTLQANAREEQIALTLMRKAQTPKEEDGHNLKEEVIRVKEREKEKARRKVARSLKEASLEVNPLVVKKTDQLASST